MINLLIIFVAHWFRYVYCMSNFLDKEIEISISGIRKLIEAVNKKHGFDLGNFALTSFKRRLIKALQKNELKNIEDLTEKLVSDKSFFDKFLSDIDVECTEFFRDPAFWRYLRDELLPVLGKNLMKIKIWIPGCSTGEEALTASIVILESGLKDKAEILATDITPYTINKPGKRIFSNSKIEISDSNYQRFNDGKTSFSQYIEPQVNGFSVCDKVYDNIKFELNNYHQEVQQHNMFNLIICRNIFIYYTSQYQEKLLEIFTNKLIYNGYLAIGNMEDISWCKDFNRYREVNNSEKVYKKID